MELKADQIIELMEYQYTIRAELLKFCKACPERSRREETQNLFISSPPVGLNYSNRNDCKEIWKRLSQEIREQDKNFINFKQVGTSVITHWLKHYNLREVPYMAGHRYVSSTEAYMVNQMEDLQTDIDQFYPF